MAVPGLEEEFRDFVAARSSALLRTAYLLTGDWATAEDLLQTALTKTYLAWKRLGTIDAVEPYTRRIMVNTATSWWRRRWHGERPTEVLPERAGPDQHEVALQRDLMWRHIRALPARQRAVLVLRFYEDMSEAQTAELMEISPGTVKSQTSRALATLRRRLGAEGVGPRVQPADQPSRAPAAPAPASSAPVPPALAAPAPPASSASVPRARPAPAPSAAVPAARTAARSAPTDPVWHPPPPIPATVPQPAPPSDPPVPLPAPGATAHEPG